MAICYNKEELEEMIRKLEDSRKRHPELEYWCPLCDNPNGDERCYCDCDY